MKIKKTILLLLFCFLFQIFPDETKIILRSTKLENLKKNNPACIPLCFCVQTLRKVCIVYMLYITYVAYTALQEPQQESFLPWQWLNRSFKYAQQLSIFACALAKIIGVHYVSKWAVEYTCPKIMKTQLLADHTTSTDC